MRSFLFCLFLMPVMLAAQGSMNMTVLSTLNIPNLEERFGAHYNDCWGFRHANGTEVAIIGAIEKVFFIDVTVPGDPQIILEYDVKNYPTGTTNQSLWRDFKTYGNYAYASADEGTSGLLIFDLSNVPDTVTLLAQTTSFWNRAHNIFIDTQHGKLYASGTNSVGNGLVILDLESNPSNPSTFWNVPLNGVGGGYVHETFVRDNIAYCSHGNLHKLQMYDFSDLPNFSVVGVVENYPEPGYNHSSWVSDNGQWLVMADETHGSDLKLVDITDPFDISIDDYHTFYSELLGAGAPGSSIVHNPFILGDLAYLAYYHDGVQVFDISDPEDITLFAYYDTYPDNTNYNDYEGCWGVYPYLPSGLIIASDMTYGLYVMELSSPPLDIDFISFDASREGKFVRLDWVIADASNGNKFRVSRSLDGQTFEHIGYVPLLAGETHYTYQDRHVFGNSKYTYKIEFVHLDGSTIDSPLRVVRTFEATRDFNVINPVNDKLLVNVLRPIAKADFSLYNIEGKLIWSDRLDHPQSQEEFSIGHLPGGQYVLTIQTDSGSENMILQKSE